MKKIKLKVRRQTIEALIRYLEFSQQWANQKYQQTNSANIMVGSVLYDIRLRLFNKLAQKSQLLNYQLTLDLHEAHAFMIYFNEEAINGKYDRIFINEFADKINRQL